MQLASWLLLQRAVNEGELTFDQARTEKMKVKLSPFPALAPDVLELLPKKLCVLISDSRRLHDQVLRLDALVYGGGSILPAETPSASNPVESQLGLLKAAFGQDR
jgi:regulator of CtrA degradation